MDKRKLIGTIIGVMLFAALIVGATYAWLSFTADVTNTNVSTGGANNGDESTLTYWVDYAKGESITELPIIDTDHATNGPTPTNTAVTTVTAKMPQYSIADNIKLFLTSSDGQLSTGGKVRYLACENACTENDFKTKTLGSVSKAGTVEIFAGKLNGNPSSTTNPTHTYKVYMWLDAEMIVNADIGQTYSGFIHASSSQGDSTVYK